MNAGKPLVQCPRCESTLVQLEGWFSLDGELEDMIVGRRCPECEYHDDLVLSGAAFAVLRQHHAELFEYLADFADRLATADELRIRD